MFDHEDELFDRVVEHLKRPVHVDPTLDGRVMAEIGDGSARQPGPAAAAWHWLVTPRRFSLSPLAGMTAAAAIAAFLVLRGPATPTGRPTTFQFVFVAPQASSVSLVGDFNDWDPTRSPMTAARLAGLWSAVLPLDPGRYRYAFLVDGVHWQPDPTAPRAGDDEFGVPSSVVTVGGT